MGRSERWSLGAVARVTVRWVLAASLCHALTALAAHHALVVGIEDYRALPPRSHARSEADALAKVLREQGFDVAVPQGTGARDIREAVAALRKKVGPGDTVVEFLSAHVALRAGIACLIAADARSEADWIPLQELLHGGQGMALLAFDLSGSSPVSPLRDLLPGQLIVIAQRPDAGTSELGPVLAEALVRERYARDAVRLATWNLAARTGRQALVADTLAGDSVPLAEPGPVEQRSIVEALASAPRTRQIVVSSGASVPAAPAPARPPLPSFPWPPPQPSTRAELPRSLFLPSSSQQAVADQLLRALERARYSEYSFYSAPGGFALVARLERIADDGTPLPEQLRFLGPAQAEPFSLNTYVQRLFFAPQGYYRQIVFVATDQPFAAVGAALDATGASKLLAEGANRLPAALGSLPFTPGHGVSALVYEFRKGAADRDVSVLTPGRLTALDHLLRAGLLPALGAR
jgi:hypothetical protein